MSKLAKLKTVMTKMKKSKFEDNVKNDINSII